MTQPPLSPSCAAAGLPSSAEPTSTGMSAELGLHVTLLFTSAAVLLAASLLSIGDDSRTVSLPLSWASLPELPLPELCASRRLWGIDCLGCGLTRSFISFAHGRLLDAWRYNAGGCVLFAAVAFQVPYRLLQLWRMGTGRHPWECWLAGQIAFVVVLGLLVANWLTKQLGFF